MAVTIADIAKRADVSRQTAGYIINGQGRLFRPETQRRVMAACRELGYRPNAGARAMRRGRFDAVGLCASSRGWLTNISERLLGGIHDRLAELGQHLVYARLQDEQLASKRYVPKVLQHLMVDGLLISYTHDIPAELLRRIRDTRVPAIWINSLLADNCVLPDDADAGRQATDRLIQQGHRRIAFAAFPFAREFLRGGKGHFSIRGRYQGYCAAMRAAGLVPRLLPSLAKTVAHGHPPIDTTFLRAPDAPSAIVSYSAYGMTEVSVTAQLQHPRGTPVIAVFEDDATWICGRRVDTWIVPWREIGREAVDLLMQRISAPEHICPVRHVPFRFEPGEPA